MTEDSAAPGKKAMNEEQVTESELAGRLRASAAGVYTAEMAIGILLTPTPGGGTLADSVRDHIHLTADCAPATVDWASIMSALHEHTLAVSPEQARMMRIASLLSIVEVDNPAAAMVASPATNDQHLPQPYPPTDETRRA